jgi:F0F1-type ATP synthase assembly protein I
MNDFIRGLRRHRALFLFGGAVVAALLSYVSDPDSGLSTVLGGLAILQGVWAVGAAHWARKALMDYPEADMRKLFAEARRSATGAGLALVAIAIMFAALLVVFAPRAHAAELPPGALKYGPVLKAEQVKYWPSHPDPAVLASLVEQESCVSLKSARCWSPRARLKTDREEGAGVGQITRAWRQDGSLRFDTLTAMRKQYAALSEWSWENVYTRPDLQLRAVVLLSKESNTPFRAAPAMLAFGDAAYNGGAGGVQKERRACALTRGCDAGQWFGHVERHCLKSRQPLYGTRSACDINREHVRLTLLVRRDKYVRLMSARAS